MSTAVDYEQARCANIERNKQRLQLLNIDKLSLSLGKKRQGSTGQKRSSKKVKLAATPSRTSRRLRGQRPEKEFTEKAKPSMSEKELMEEYLVPMEEYFKNKNPKVVVDGHFSGWVQEDVRQRLGIAKDATAAWESNGGGTWSYKHPAGAPNASETPSDTNSTNASSEQTPGKTKKSSKGWSNARAVAASLIRKNPNAYFYRHVEPDQEQAFGDWTEAEHDRFIETAKKYGCGDKWGLFASYIPNRVGYQCSCYYRQVILRDGEIFDPNYKMNGVGQAVYVGNRFGNKRKTTSQKGEEA